MYYFYSTTSPPPFSPFPPFYWSVIAHDCIFCVNTRSAPFVGAPAFDAPIPIAFFVGAFFWGVVLLVSIYILWDCCTLLYGAKKKCTLSIIYNYFTSTTHTVATHRNMTMCSCIIHCAGVHPDLDPDLDVPTAFHSHSINHKSQSNPSNFIFLLPLQVSVRGYLSGLQAVIEKYVGPIITSIASRKTARKTRNTAQQGGCVMTYGNTLGYFNIFTPE